MKELLHPYPHASEYRHTRSSPWSSQDDQHLLIGTEIAPIKLDISMPGICLYQLSIRAYMVHPDMKRVPRIYQLPQRRFKGGTEGARGTYLAVACYREYVIASTRTSHAASVAGYVATLGKQLYLRSPLRA